MGSSGKSQKFETVEVTSFYRTVSHNFLSIRIRFQVLRPIVAHHVCAAAFTTRIDCAVSIIKQRRAFIGSVEDVAGSVIVVPTYRL